MTFFAVQKNQSTSQLQSRFCRVFCISQTTVSLCSTSVDGHFIRYTHDCQKPDATLYLHVNIVAFHLQKLYCIGKKKYSCPSKIKIENSLSVSSRTSSRPSGRNKPNNFMFFIPYIIINQTKQCPTNALLLLFQILYITVSVSWSSIFLSPPGILVRDSCESINYTNKTNKVSTC